MALAADFDPELPRAVRRSGVVTGAGEFAAPGGDAVGGGEAVGVVTGAGEFAAPGGDAVGGGEAVGVVTGAGEFAATGDCSEPAAGEAGAPATTTDVELAALGGCAANASLVSTIEASQPAANNVTIRGIGGRDVPEDGRDLPT